MNTAVITYQTADGNKGAIWFNGDNLRDMKERVAQAQLAISHGRDWTLQPDARSTYADRSIKATTVVIAR